MPPSHELGERLKDPNLADTAMMEVARHYILEPGISLDELVELGRQPPFLNGMTKPRVEAVLDRILTTHQIIPKARKLIEDLLTKIGFAAEGEDDLLEQYRSLATDSAVLAKAHLDTIHSLLTKVETLAEHWNLPVRELQAALARVGIETALFFIKNSQDPEITGLAKINLLFFSDIEMLSIGVRTNSHMFSFVDPANVRPELIASADRISPLVDVSNDDKLKGALAFGEIEVTEKVPSGVPGIDFLHIK